MNRKNFNTKSTRAMRRAHLQPGYTPALDLKLAAEAGLPIYVRPVTEED